MAVRTVQPGTDLAGSWERTQPLPVAAGYEPIEILATASAGYQGGDSNATSVQNQEIELPDIGNAVPREIEQVGSTTYLTFVDSFATSFNITLTSTPILAGDLIIIDTATQEQTDPGAPNTPTNFTLRGSWYSSAQTAWVPRFSRYYRIASGGEESDVINITHGTSTRLHAKATVWRNVDQNTPFAVTPTQNHYVDTPDPGSVSGVPVGAIVLSTLASNVFPDGADSFNTGTQGPSGYTLVSGNQTEPRFWLEYRRKQLVAGSEEPGLYGAQFDNWTHVTDALTPALGSGGGDIALIMFTAVADNTGTPDISGSPPEVAATDELQRVTSNAVGVNFSLTFNGSTTGVIATDATAATIETALEALPSIGSGNVSVTGGPIDVNPVVVQFTGALGDTDVPMLTSVNDLDIEQVTRGTAGFTFTYEFEVNTPTADSTYTPQIQYWSAVPANYVAGDRITFTNSNQFPLHTWTGALLVVQGADVADIFGAAAADTLGNANRATFADVATTIPGSRVLSILGKASETHYPGAASNATAPINRLCT